LSSIKFSRLFQVFAVRLAWSLRRRFRSVRNIRSRPLRPSRLTSTGALPPTRRVKPPNGQQLDPARHIVQTLISASKICETLARVDYSAPCLVWPLRIFCPAHLSVAIIIEHSRFNAMRDSNNTFPTLPVLSLNLPRTFVWALFVPTSHLYSRAAFVRTNIADFDRPGALSARCPTKVADPRRGQPRREM